MTRSSTTRGNKPPTCRTETLTPFRSLRCRRSGYKSKSTNPKRRQIQNGDTPKWRQTKTMTLQNGDNQNGDTPKQRHNQDGDNQNGACCILVCHRFGCVAVLTCRRFGYNQNGDKSKTAARLNSNNPTYPKCHVDLYPKRCMSPFWCVAILDVSLFWRVTVLDTYKHSVWERNKVGFVAVLACRNFGFVAVLACHRFGCVVVLVVAVLACCCFSCRRFGSVAALVVAILDVSLFWLSPFWLLPF